jgi:hypothetical protein
LKTSKIRETKSLDKYFNVIEETVFNEDEKIDEDLK